MLDYTPSLRTKSYLDSVRRADMELGSCPAFHWIDQNNHKLVRVSLRPLEVQNLLCKDAGRPGLAGKTYSADTRRNSYWK